MDDGDEDDDDAVGGTSLRQMLEDLPDEEMQVVVTQQDLLRSLAGCTPSVSQEEKEHYDELRRQFSAPGSV